jgi:hypothetical protein
MQIPTFQRNKLPPSSGLIQHQHLHHCENLNFGPACLIISGLYDKVGTYENFKVCSREIPEDVTDKLMIEVFRMCYRL